jgi:formylglycine-generating enzyme required for sulfatase activity
MHKGILFLFLLFVPQDVPQDMVQIPAGDFWMGRQHQWLIDELGMQLRLRLDDQPAHLTTLDSYFIDKYEVTNEKYAKFVDATGHRKPFHWVKGKIPLNQEQLPVYNVSWDDADAYCKWAGKRLPSEAEWEKAARGGSDKITMYPWGDQLNLGAGRGGAAGAGAVQKQAHFGFPNGPAKVGSYPPNGYGLYDMIGNVAEWTNDWYNRTYYSISPEKNPTGPNHGMYRVFRGSSWSDSDERMLGTHYRNYTNPELRTDVLGFRCVRN